MTPRFLELVEVLEIHQSRIESYGGSLGVRDVGLLQSALAQPEAGFGEQYLHADEGDVDKNAIAEFLRKHVSEG